MTDFGIDSPAMRWMLRKGHEIAGTYAPLSVAIHCMPTMDDDAGVIRERFRRLVALKLLAIVLTANLEES